MNMSVGGSTDSMSMSRTSTMPDMPMASSTSSSVSSHTIVDMDTMAMTFFTSSTTPLYSMDWTPTTAGQYAGTCIFLIALATIFRSLLALRVHIYPLLNVIETRRKGGLQYEPYQYSKSSTYPWRAREAVLIGFVDVVIAGLAYLLMIAVMTMNVGYFVSVLAGVFLGSVIFGHYMPNAAAH